MSDVTETDYTTNPPTITERAFTKAEKEQRQADAAAYEAAETERVAAAAQQATDRAAAIEHAKSLGFTDAMISVMYPTLLEA